MRRFELCEADIETLIYALNVTYADLQVSSADERQSNEDRQAWAGYMEEIQVVTTKLAAVSQAP